MGLRRFSGTLDAENSEFTVPMKGFNPTMTVYVAGRIDSATGNAAYATFFDPATKELSFYTAAGTKKTSGTIWFELVVMGDL